MWQSIKQRWEAEETKLGKFFKYYIGYVGIAAGFLSGVLTDLSGVYTSIGVAVPLWITKGLIGCGIAGYVAGKWTKKNDSSKPIQ